MKIRRLRVTSYRGIAELDTEIAPSGAIVRGKSDAGKTSVLRSIRAALAAQDISPDAIKNGSDKAEILIDLDDHTVRRVITAKGSTLTVEKAGMKASKPTAYLTDLLGTSPLDPLDLFLAKPKDRRALILAALPVTVTREQLAKYATDLPLDFSTEGHGLEVVERARKFFYDERTVANKEASDAKREAARLSEDATTIARGIAPGPALSVAEATAAVSVAERELAAIEGRAETAAAAHLRTAGQRQRVEALRAEAVDEVKSAGEPTPTQALEDLLEEASESVRVLEKELASSRAALVHLTAQLVQAKTDNERHARAKGRAADLRTRADEILATLAEAAIDAPTTAEIQAADGRLKAARAARDRADQQAKALAAVDLAETAKKTARELAEEADELDATVKRLSNEAPTELLAAADGIPGLTLEGDDVLLDGVRLDALSGSKQVHLATEIARRANSKSRILVCDGLERLDPDLMEEFVRHATRDGFQLIATRVDRGAVVIEAIEPAETAAAAE